MKKLVAICLFILVVTLLAVSPVFAQTPNENASQVANCATSCGGQQVAQCAQNMERGASECAQLTGACPMR